MTGSLRVAASVAVAAGTGAVGALVVAAWTADYDTALGAGVLAVVAAVYGAVAVLIWTSTMRTPEKERPR